MCVILVSCHVFVLPSKLALTGKQNSHISSLLSQSHFRTIPACLRVLQAPCLGTKLPPLILTGRMRKAKLPKQKHCVLENMCKMYEIQEMSLLLIPWCKSAYSTKEKPEGQQWEAEAEKIQQWSSWLILQLIDVGCCEFPLWERCLSSVTCLFSWKPHMSGHSAVPQVLSIGNSSWLLQLCCPSQFLLHNLSAIFDTCSLSLSLSHYLFFWFSLIYT